MRLGGALCSAFRAWPDSFLNGEADALFASGLGDSSGSEFDSLRLSQTATEQCPDTLPIELASPNGRFPRPNPTTVSLPSVFDHSEESNVERDLVRYQWTAIGLGCMGLTSHGDSDPREMESRFLSAMGYSLEQYLQASADLNDPTASDRIFQRIRYCVIDAGITTD